MKRTKTFSITLLALLVLMLTGCGKSEFGVTENTGKLIMITADSADKDAFFMTGSLEVADGEQIIISSELTKGSIRVEIVDAPDEQNMNELPEMDSEAIITANVSRTDGASGTVPPGNYLLRATCLEKATGTVRIEVKPAEPQVTETVETPVEDGQNPVMNFIGVYHSDDSIEALVEADGIENAKITVTWAGSPWFRTVTVMTGRFDSDTLTMEFNGTTLMEYTFKSDGSVAEETVTDTDNRGKAVFNYEANTLTITEVFESGNIDTVYEWGPASDMKTVSDPEDYAAVTAMDKYEVETIVGFNVRTAYLSENWYTLADMIWYPITINGIELADADAFLGYMMDKTVAESDREAMMEEDFLDMFVNGQGICMGSGQIWLNDPNYMTDAEPELKIIAISGIVDR